jgi:hypothetical protein
MENPSQEDRRHRFARLTRSSVTAVTSRGSDIAELRDRVQELEEEVRECRRLNRRVAELTDVVAELLLPAAQQDENGLRERLERYSSSL